MNCGRMNCSAQLLSKGVKDSPKFSKILKKYFDITICIYYGLLNIHQIFSSEHRTMSMCLSLKRNPKKISKKERKCQIIDIQGNTVKTQRGQ